MGKWNLFKKDLHIQIMILLAWSISLFLYIYEILRLSYKEAMILEGILIKNNTFILFLATAFLVLGFFILALINFNSD